MAFIWNCCCARCLWLLRNINNLPSSPWYCSHDDWEQNFSYSFAGMLLLVCPVVDACRRAGQQIEESPYLMAPATSGQSGHSRQWVSGLFHGFMFLMRICHLLQYLEVSKTISSNLKTIPELPGFLYVSIFIPLLVKFTALVCIFIRSC